MKQGSKLFGIVLAAVWLVSALGLVAQVNAKKSQELTGVISNTHCGLKHSSANAGDAGCVNMCVKGNNASYALVSTGKLYTLEGNAEEFAKFAGQRVKVSGQLMSTTMKVEAVEATK